MTQQLFFGDESPHKVRNLILSNGWNRILIVTGKKSYESSGAEGFVRDCLKGMDVMAARFCDFANNPNVTDLNNSLTFAWEFNPSAIIAIGGGSVLDMAKLLRFYLTHDGKILSGQYRQNERNIPLIAIPTTAGTGAEATHFAVLYDGLGKKHSIADKSILPDYAVVYPPLTYGQTSYVTACTGFDALAQAIEAYWNKNATEESDGYAEKAMDLIYPSLPDAVNSPTKEVRDRMAEGAYCAGRAINITKTTAPHAFSYPFTSHYGIPHGHAVAIVFPIIAKFNMTVGEIPSMKKDRLYDLSGGRELFLNNLNGFITSIGLSLPKNIDYDMDLLLDGINLDRLANNPVKITESQSCELLKRIIEIDQ